MFLFTCDGDGDDEDDNDGYDDDGDDNATDAYPYNTGENKSFYFQCFWVSPIGLCHCQDWSV